MPMRVMLLKLILEYYPGAYKFLVSSLRIISRYAIRLNQGLIEKRSPCNIRHV